MYLDTAATTKPRKEVVDAVIPYMTDDWHNPSALYYVAKKVKRDVERVRYDIADLINAKSNEIYFTSGACESNSWAIRGWDDYVHYGNDNYYRNSYIITTQVEHKSMMNAVMNPMLLSNVHLCDVDEYGFIDMKELERVLKDKHGNPMLVSVIAANSEIGTVQPLKEIADLVHKYGGVFHTDATQMLPHIPIDVEEIGIDMLSASAQKFGGLKGCGFLYKREGIEIMPLIHGGQEGGKRGGTENTVGIIALGEAIKHIDYERNEELKFMRDYFVSELVDIGCKLNGSIVSRLPNNINVMLPEGIMGESLLYMLELSNVYISTGSACDSRSVNPSHVLKSIGLNDDEASRSIRISIPSDITKDDIAKAVSVIEKEIDFLRSEL